ncbi:hypothetical protein LWM68_09930 [Niabella sp. W65]|nr:hypothetical protein [Niabella sp. W65]MCH7363058.1 hypothetical protein [Niabella sp. W65]ULT38991.1 hypothetical protein KRR40_28615 [Niabella sp. I65]
MDTLALLAKEAGNIIQTVKGATNPQVEKVGGLPKSILNMTAPGLPTMA